MSASNTNLAQVRDFPEPRGADAKTTSWSPDAHIVNMSCCHESNPHFASDACSTLRTLNNATRSASDSSIGRFLTLTIIAPLCPAQQGQEHARPEPGRVTTR